MLRIMAAKIQSTGNFSSRNRESVKNYLKDPNRSPVTEKITEMKNSLKGFNSR